MTAQWSAPCDWPDDPAELERQLAAAEAAYDLERERAHVDLHGPQPVRRRTRLTERDMKWLNNFETVTVIGEVL